MTKLEILKYILHTPENTNTAILEQMLNQYKSTPVVTNSTVITEIASNPNVHSFELTEPIEAASETQFNHKIYVDGADNPVTTSTTGKVWTFLAGADCENIVLESTAANETWASSYGAHFYTGQSTVSNGKFHGHNAGILVNGGTLTLKGAVDVSNNYFGGIEVSKGAAAGLEPSVLDVSDCTLINDSEEYGKPTIWVDGVDETVGRVIGGNLTEVLFTKEDGTQQLHYYLHPINAKPAK